MEHAETLERRRRRRAEVEPRRTVVRNVAVAFASAGVLALLVAYAVAAPTPELALTVGHVVPQPGATTVVQGRVLEPDAGGLRGLRVEVRGGGLAAAAVSDRAGRFRVDLTGGCSVYQVALRARWHGSTLERNVRRRLCPGETLPVDARVVTQGHFLWVPGPR
jgi:hypothetical protein